VNHSTLSYEKFFEDLLNSYGKENKLKLGFIAGGFCNINFTNFLNANIDLLFLQKGDKYTVEINNQTFTAKKTLNYLSFSPKIGAFLKTQTIKPYLLFGPGFNLKLSGTAKSTGDDEIDDSDMSDDLKTISYDLIFVSGIEINALTMFAEIRYYLGLSDLPKNNWANFKSHTFAFVVGKAF
jgi:hypothetical protein